jgi:hypothetical protein
VGDIPDLLETTYTDAVNDFIVEVHHKADKAENHVAFQGEVPEYVSRAARLRQMADELGPARDAAAGGDKIKTKELENMIKAGKLALTMNAKHIIMLSLHRNDPNILIDCGYEPKGKTSKSKVTVNLLDYMPEVDMRHGGVSGEVHILVKRLKPGANVELQTATQDPNVESSWSGGGMFAKYRIEQKGLEPATRFYARARYHENGNAGRWCKPVEIIVL